jgi:hypothetical protein
VSILTRWRNRPVSPRRARRMYEAERLATLAEDLDRANARRERERNRPCRFCAAAEEAPMSTGRPEEERFTEDGEVRVSLGGGKSIPVKDAADYFRYINGEAARWNASLHNR